MHSRKGAFSVPHFKVINLQFASDAGRLCNERVSSFLCRRHKSSLAEEWHGAKDISKKPALVPKQRQNSLNYTVFFGHQIERLPLKCSFNNVLPWPTMVIEAHLMLAHERLPAVGILRARDSDLHSAPF
jgi:hypothetical protein